MKAFDTRKKGDPATLFAQEVNAWNKTAKQSGGVINKVPPSNTDTQNSIVFVRNDSGEDVEQYHVMVIEQFIFDPFDEGDQARADDAFKAQTSFIVNKYDETNTKHIGAQVCILQEPIANGKVGMAMIAGSSQIRVDIKSEKHKYIALLTQSTIPESGNGGQFGVIALQGNTGEGWAYVEILPRPETKQFVFIDSTEKDIINCYELNGDKVGTTVVKVALPWLLRRTPFDGVVDPEKMRDPLKRYEYQEWNKRKLYYKEEETDTEENEEFQEIRDPYLKNDVLICRRNVVGLDVEDELEEPVEWIDTNDAGRWWYENPDGEDEPGVAPEDEPGYTTGPAG